MMGRTNTVYAETSETSELSLNIESVLTSTTDDIWKIEHVNNMFFVFLENGKVMYGEEIAELGYLKKEGEYFTASHVIYTNGIYAFIDQEAGPADKITIYTTNDLMLFASHVIQIKNNSSKNLYPLGIFLSSKGKIVILFAQSTAACLGVFNSIDDISEDETGFVITQNILAPSSVGKGTIIYKDRLFLFHTDLTSFYSISLDGNVESLERRFNLYFVGDMIYHINNGSLYYSINGINYSKLGEYANDNISILNMIEYDENQIGVFLNDNNGKKVFALAESHTHIIDAISSAVDASAIIGDITCACTVGLYTYLGSTGGTIYKTFADYSGSNNTPHITVLKSLSAKQALIDSKMYTDQMYAKLEARIATLEMNRED